MGEVNSFDEVGSERPDLNRAYEGLAQYIIQHRQKLLGAYAEQDSLSLNWAFDAENRSGQRVNFSYGRAIFVVGGIKYGGEVHGVDGQIGTGNGLVKTSGIFKRFDVVTDYEKLVVSGREIEVEELCLVCEEQGPVDLDLIYPREVYYPIVNLGDDGLQFEEG